MSSLTIAAGIRHLRGRMAAQCRSDDSDEQLLRAFLDRCDADAFAVLVGRHGPMVLHVCRRVLDHEQDAEDAFQATFLLLARSAAGLRNKPALAAYLHGAAYRIARTAQRSAARRRKHEDSLGALTQPRSAVNPADELSWREVRTILDEEIAALPEKYRTAFVLCCLENLSQAEAARRLGVKERTLSSRLAAARKRLAQRLPRRGVELTALLAATTLATPPLSAVPAGLMAGTIEAVLATAAGEKLVGVVSAAVAELVRSTTAAMVMSKAKMATVVLLAVSLLTAATSGSLVSWYGRASGPLAATPTDDKPKTASPQTTAAKGVEIQGRVLDPEGKPKAGAKLLLLSHGANGKVTQAGASAADGRFSVLIPQIQEELSPALIAQADGAGLDFIDLGLRKPGEPVELRLVKDREVRGRIVNTEGKPVVGARLTVENIGIGDNKSLDSFLTQWKKKDYGLAIPDGIQMMAPLDDSWHQRVALFDAMTDAEGRFAFRGLGEERFVWFRLSGGGVATKELWIVNRGGFDPQPYNQAARDNVPKGFEIRSASEMLRGPDSTVIAEAEKIIRGIVKNADSGKGQPNVVVHLSHAGNRSVEAPLQATTDTEGRYQIRGAHKAKSYSLEVAEDAALGYMPSRLEAADTAGYQPVTADIKVKKGVIITGKMIDGVTGKPVRGFAEAAVLVGNPFAKEYPPFDLISGWFRRKETDADGNFRVVAIPGPVLLMGGPSNLKTIMRFKPPTPDPKYPHFFDTKTLSRNFPSFIDFRNAARPIQGNFCTVLEIKVGTKIVEQDIVLERVPALPIRIQDAEGNPLSGAWVGGSGPRGGYPAIQCEKAECSAYQLEPGKSRLLVFFHPARKLACTLRLKGDEKTPVTAKLGPTGSIKGRLLDVDGKPMAGVVVDVRYRQRSAEEVRYKAHRAKQIVTDSVGAFTFDDMIPDQTFELSFRRGKHEFERTPKLAHPTIEVKSGECRDLGAIRAKRVLEKSDE